MLVIDMVHRHHRPVGCFHLLKFPWVPLVPGNIARNNGAFRSVLTQSSLVSVSEVYILSAIDTFNLCGPPRAMTIDWIIGEFCEQLHCMCIKIFRLILNSGKRISYESLNHVILKWYLLTIRIFMIWNKVEWNFVSALSVSKVTVERWDTVSVMLYHVHSDEWYTDIEFCEYIMEQQTFYMICCAVSLSPGLILNFVNLTILNNKMQYLKYTKIKKYSLKSRQTNRQYLFEIISFKLLSIKVQIYSVFILI